MHINHRAMTGPKIYLLIALIFSLEVCAERTLDYLAEGFVVTKADTIKGEVKVDLNRNVVSVKDGSKDYNLVASQIRRVVVNGPDGSKGYLSGVFGADSNYMLFEILSDGGIVLLYRQGVKFSQFDEEAFPPFFVARENSIYSISSKKEILAQMESRASDVKVFLKENKTDFEDKESLTALFHFYNGVTDPSQMFALKD